MSKKILVVDDDPTLVKVVQPFLESHDLNALSIESKELFYNLSFDELFQHETAPGLNGYEKAIITTSGAVAVDTGRFTGRSPKDKYFVKDAQTQDTIWWANTSGSDNKP